MNKSNAKIIKDYRIVNDVNVDDVFLIVEDRANSIYLRNNDADEDVIVIEKTNIKAFIEILNKIDTNPDGV